MTRHTLVPIAALLLLTGCGQTSHPLSAPTAVPEAAGRLGVHLLLDDGRNRWTITRWGDHLPYAREVAGEWGYVVQLIQLDDLDAAKWQNFFDLCATHRLIPVVRLATRFDRSGGYWQPPPTDPDGGYDEVAERYVTFLTALDWRIDQHHIIVGNEPNHGDEWGGRANPAAYARFFATVADAIRAADPHAVIMNAPLDNYTPHTNEQPFIDGMIHMDSESFLDAMIAEVPDIFERVDVWGSHPYPAQFRAPPWEQAYIVHLLNGATNPQHVEPPPGVMNRGINGYEWELFKLATYGVTDLPVMITETGWRHAETVDPRARDSGDGRHTLPPARTAAIYLDLALHGNNGRYPDLPADGWTPWLSDSRITAVIPFALNGDPREWGHTNWLRLAPNGDVFGMYPLYEVFAAAHR